MSASMIAFASMIAYAQGGLLSKRYDISSRFVLLVFSKRRLKFLDVFRHSIIKPHDMHPSAQIIV